MKVPPTRLTQSRLWGRGFVVGGLALLRAATILVAGSEGLLGLRGAEPPVSFARQVVPLLRNSCWGCHRPEKAKGGIDLTTYAEFLKGGKHGPGFIAGHPDQSRVLEEIRGSEPSMPKEGEPLTGPQVALIERWVREGAVDDTPVTSSSPPMVPRYAAPPIITSLAYSPSSPLLAVAGNREVLVFNSTNYERLARLVGDAPRIESLRFSPDGNRLAVAGGSPGLFGEIQIWEVANARSWRVFRVGHDSLYGVDWSPDQTRVCFGASDKAARVIEVEGGRELVRFDQHSDWVFGAVFLRKGDRLVTGSRDKSLKLVDATHGALLEVLNRDTEAIRCLARHPSEDWVVMGSEVRPRLYKAEERKDRTNLDGDPNQIREFEHFDGGVTALAFSPDGKWLASTGSPAGEVRIHEVSSGARKATLRGHLGIVFALAFSSDGTRLASAGYEGRVRVFDWSRERLLTNFVPVEISPPGPLARQTP